MGLKAVRKAYGKVFIEENLYFGMAAKKVVKPNLRELHEKNAGVRLSREPNAKASRLIRHFMEDNGCTYGEAVRWAKAHIRRGMPECKDYEGR